MMRKFWWQYLMAALVILAASTLSYVVVAHEVETYAVSSSRNLIAQASEDLDNRLYEMEMLAIRTSFNRDLVRVKAFSDPFDDSSLEFTLNFIGNFQDHSLYNTIVHTNCVIFQKSGMVAFPNNTSTLELLVKNLYREDGAQPFTTEEFITLLTGMNKNFGTPLIYKNGGMTVKVIPYTKVLYGQDHTNAFIFILLNAQYIDNLLDKVRISDDTIAFILNEKNEIISSNHTVPVELQYGEYTDESGIEYKKVNGRRVIVTHISSTVKNWRYITVNDAGSLTESLVGLRIILTFIIMAMAALCILMIYVIIFHNTRPILRIMKTLMPAFGSGAEADRSDIYETIRISVSRLINDRQALKAALDRQMPAVIDSLVDKLITGEAAEQKEIDIMLDRIGYTPKGNYFSTVIISLLAEGTDDHLTVSAVKRFEEWKLVLKKALESLEYPLVCDLNRTDIAVILSHSTEDLDEFSKTVEMLYKDLRSVFSEAENMQFNFAVGSIQKGILGCPDSYYEARTALDKMFAEKCENIIWATKGSSTGSGSYYFPPETEMRLIHAVKAGNRSKAEEIMNEIYRMNFFERQLEPPLTKFLIFDLSSTILKIAGDANEEERAAREEVKNLLHEDLNRNFIPMCKKLMEILMKLSDFFGRNKRSHNRVLAEEIMEYIQDKFNDADMCLTSIADRFNLSSGYLSAFFKEQTGVGLSEYIERARMEHSKALLISTDMTVADIAAETGYISANTFCRAFKRYFGMNALALRQEHKQ